MSQDIEPLPPRVETLSRIVQVAGTAVLMLFSLAQPVAASHGTLECSASGPFEPLFELLHAVTELAFLGGVGLATLGFTAAGVLIILPGQEYNRRGKEVAKGVLIGTILLLSANMMVQFIVNQLGGTIC